jgi:uncharacterized protein (DUF697 family)
MILNPKKENINLERWNMAESDPRLARAEALVKGYMLGALAVGLVPLPLVSMVARAGMQLKMLHSLANLYKIEFFSQLGRALIASLLGGGIRVLLSSQVARFAAKSLPLYGWVAGLITGSLFGGAGTYAMGKVLIQHFESGGTFLTFDPQQVRDYYAQQFEEGKEEVRKSFVGVKP